MMGVPGEDWEMVALGITSLPPDVPADMLGALEGGSVGGQVDGSLPQSLLWSSSGDEE
jgi:hypothetical protein